MGDKKSAWRKSESYPSYLIHSELTLAKLCVPLRLPLCSSAFKKFFIEVGVPVSERISSPTVTPADIEKVLAAAPRYGMVLKLFLHLLNFRRYSH